MVRPVPSTDAALQRQRDLIRRNALRANTAVAGILLAVLALAVVAWLASIHSAGHQHRAEAAELEAREQLRKSYLAQARLLRLGGEMTARFDALAAISNAAAIRPTLDLRNEAIAALALTAATNERPLWRFSSMHQSAVCSSDFERYAVMEPTLGIALYRMSDHQKIARLDIGSATVGSTNGYLAMGFSASGRYLGAILKNGSAQAWNARDGSLLFEFHPRRFANTSVGAFSPHEDLFGYYDSDRNEIRLVDLRTGLEVPQAAKIGLRSFEFRPHTKEIATVNGREARIWNYETGELIRTFQHPGEVLTLSWSSDGAKLAVQRGNGEVYLHDLVADQTLVLSGHTEGGWAPQFSPGGNLVFSESKDGTTRLWDAALGRLLWRTSEGRGLTFSRNGSQLAYVRPAIGLGVWRITPPHGFRTFLCRGGRDGIVSNIDLSPDGRWLVALVRGGFQLWDLDEREEPLFYPIRDISAVALHPSGEAVVLGRRKALEIHPLGPEGVATLSLTTNAPAAAEGVPRIPIPDNGDLRDFSVSGDGRTAVVNLLDRRLIVVDLRGERPPVPLNLRERWVYSVGAGASTGSGRFAVSPDGRFVVIAYGITEGPSVWDARTGEMVKELPVPTALGAFSPDGRHLLTASINQYNIWTVDDWTSLFEQQCDGLAGIRGQAAITADGNLLAIAPTRQRITLFDPNTGTELASLEPPLLQSIRAIRMARDGRRLAVATANNLVQVWDLADIRRELAGMGLDWGDASVLSEEITPAMLRADSSNGLLLPGLLAVSIAGVAASIVLRRHRRVIADFLSAEALAEQRQLELSRARVELIQGQKMKALGTLAAGIAHDFNNLLSVIRMSNKLIAREGLDNEEVREHVASIEEAVQQGKQIVGSMLGYSRASSHDNEPHDVGELVDETVALLSREFLSGVTLTLEIDRHLPLVQVGSGKIEQMLLNLIVNAAEAMKGRGRLCISTRLRSSAQRSFVLAPLPAARYVEISVADSGPGVAPEIRDRVFEPFFTTKSEGHRPGTGLGLSMVYTIAEQQGLGLTLDTEPGRGATFGVWIPVTDSPANQSADQRS